MPHTGFEPVSFLCACPPVNPQKVQWELNLGSIKVKKCDNVKESVTVGNLPPKREIISPKSGTVGRLWQIIPGIIWVSENSLRII